MKALLSALALAVVAILAAGTATAAHTGIVAQATPAPTDTPSGMPAPTETPSAEPAATPVPETSPMPASAPPAVDIKQGGTTTNSNGPNWLDKFNRHPGPDTSGVIHGGTPTMNKTKPMTKKAKPHPAPTAKP